MQRRRGNYSQKQRTRPREELTEMESTPVHYIQVDGLKRLKRVGTSGQSRYDDRS